MATGDVFKFFIQNTIIYIRPGTHIMHVATIDNFRVIKLKYAWNAHTHGIRTSGVQVKPRPTPLAHTFLRRKSSTVGLYRARAGRLTGYPNTMNIN